MKKTVWSKLGWVSFLLIFLSACGSGVETAGNNPLPTTNPSANTPNNNPSSSPPAPKLGQVTTQAFNIGGNFPADIDIVDQPDLKNVLFITSFSPAAVLAVDLNTNPLQLSATVKGLPSLPSGSGLPSALTVVDSTHAFLLTSSALIYFNPTTSNVYQTADLTTAINLTSPLNQVNPDGSSAGTVSGSFTPTFPASVAVSGSRVAVTFSNLQFTGFSLTSAVQGIVRFFDVQGTTLSVPSTVYAATSGYNTSGLTALPNGNLLVTNTGITQFTPDFSNQEPVTPGSVDLLNPLNGQVVSTLDLGLSAPAFRSWALSPDGKNAFLGSASGGYVLEIGLSPLSLIHGVSNPIVVTNAANGTDFIDDVVMGRQGGGIYPMSFNHNSVFAVDLTGATPVLLSNSVDLSFPGNPGTVSGAGPAVLRPGTPGVDFNGPDLFVLTGNPGTLAAIVTY
ncbi:MAG: hypothetical protein U1F57_00830 [bacterium]